MGIGTEVIILYIMYIFALVNSLSHENVKKEEDKMIAQQVFFFPPPFSSIYQWEHKWLQQMELSLMLPSVAALAENGRPECNRAICLYCYAQRENDFT